MTVLSDENKAILKNELRSYLENDDIKGAVDKLADLIIDSPTVGKYEQISSFLYELGLPLLENMGDTIPDYFFAGTNIESIEIPSNISYIGDGAFTYCTNLSDVTFNEGLQVIQDSAFEGCKELCEILLPASLKEINPCAFEESGVDWVEVQSDAVISEFAFDAVYGHDVTFFIPKDLYVEGSNIRTSIDKLIETVVGCSIIVKLK